MAMRLLELVALSTILISQGAHADTTLFNGAQEVIFDDASENCLAAFNLSLACDSKVQLLSYDMDRLELTEDTLDSLCIDSCMTSLQQLEGEVQTACGNYDFEFNGAYLTAVQVVDLFFWKYNMSCLTDSSGAFCLMVEESWDVGTLNSSGQATWPQYTNKTFPNFEAGNYDGTPTEDLDGNLVDLSDPAPTFEDYGLNLSMAGQDFYQDGISLDWEGHGWPEALEYDEYPLEIQCSECFLAQYKMGIESQWGEVYDEVSDQVWNNIKANCELEWDLVPAINLSTWTATVGALEWSYNVSCGQTIVFEANDDANWTTANDLALANNIPSAALVALNSVSWNSIPVGSYCAPESCQVAVLNETIGAFNLVATYENISETQFFTWNSECYDRNGRTTNLCGISSDCFVQLPTDYMDSKNLIVGEVVCIGPPGGAYTPVTASVASPTVYTTTATPAVHTPYGTVPNCGLYYEAQSGDECNTITLAYSITLSDLYAMNPSLDANCTNLEVGYDYCVALVNGTSVTTTASASLSTSATSSNVAAPTQTVAGTTSQCYKWYTVQSGDSCATIEDTFGITLTYFRSLNTYIDAACDNLWLDYAYCVSGVAETVSSTSSVLTTTSGQTTTTKASTTTSTSTYVAAPTQTVSGTTAECYEWYTVQSGDTCEVIEDAYGITLDYFRSLNTYIDAACDNLWLGYAYCVNGIATA